MNSTIIASTIDTLGFLNARIAELTKQADALKKELVAAGVDSAEGSAFSMKIVCQFRENLDMAAVREKLSPQFITAHTTTKEVISVRISAKPALAIAA